MHSGNHSANVDSAALDASIASATKALLGHRQADGHFVFELEADATIPSEYVLLRHYLAEPVDSVLEGKVANYLRRIQGDHGGWALVYDGPFEMSASVKAYFALKMTGESIDAPHMARAREAILARGGAANSNVFTRNLLALFGAKLRLRAVAGPMAAGSALRSNSPGMKAGVVPVRLTCSIRPAICALVVSLNFSSLKIYPAALLFLFGSHKPFSGLPTSSGLGAVSS